MHLDPCFYAVANIDGGITAYVSPAVKHLTVVIIEDHTGAVIDSHYFIDQDAAIQFALDASI